MYYSCYYRTHYYYNICILTTILLQSSNMQNSYYSILYLASSGIYIKKDCEKCENEWEVSERIMRSHENLKNGKRRRRKSENNEPNHQIQNQYDKTTYRYYYYYTYKYYILFSMYRNVFKTAPQKETCLWLLSMGLIIYSHYYVSDFWA